MDRITDMTKGRPAKLIFCFAVPLILSNLGQQFYMIVDTIIVGQGVGVGALASLGATDWIYWMILWTVSSLAQGFSILVTQKFGAGDAVGLRKAVAVSVKLCVGFGIGLTAVGAAIAYPMLRVLGTPEDIFQNAFAYLVTMCSGTVIVMAYNLASAFLRSFGDGKTPLIATAIAACLNIGLDLLFVMVFRWGVVGAAVATLIAQFVAFLYCFRILRQIEMLRMEKKDWKWDRGVAGRLCRLGFPLAVQHIVITIGGMVLQSVINSNGFVFVAGFTATNKLYGLLECSAISFGYATMTYMAQNYGAGLLKRLKPGMRRAIILSVSVSVVISAAMVVFGRPALGLFISASDAHAGEVLDIAYQYLLIMSGTLFILYLLHTYRCALQGLGNTIAPMLSGCMEFVMRIGIALTLPRFLGSSGLFFAEPGAWAGAAAVLAALYYRQIHRIFRAGASEQRDT